MSFPSGSLYKISIPEVKLKSKTFTVLIEIGNEDPLFIFEYTGTLIEWGEFTIGSDSDVNEMVFLPGSFSIKIKLAQDNYSTIKRIVKGTYKFLRITINEGAGTFYSGTLVRSEDIQLDDYLCLIRFLFVDEFRMLKQKNDIAQSAGNTGTTLLNMVKQLFLDPFDYSTYALTIQSLQNFKYEYYPNLTDYLSAFGTWDGYFFSNSHFSDRTSILKAILNNLGCVAVIGFNRKILLLPRFYNRGRIVRIHRRNHEKDEIEQWIAKKYRGMVVTVMVHGFAYQKVELGIVEYVGGSYKYPEEILEIDFPLTGSSIYEPDPQQSGLCEFSFRIGDVWLYIGTKQNSFQIKLPGQNNWSSKDSLYNHIIPKLWAEFSTTRSKYKVTLFGTDYDYFTYFRFGNDRYIFRPLKFIYDFVNDKTEITMIEDVSWLFPENFDDTIMTERFIAQE